MNIKKRESKAKTIRKRSKMKIFGGKTTIDILIDFCHNVLEDLVTVLISPASCGNYQDKKETNYIQDYFKYFGHGDDLSKVIMTIYATFIFKNTVPIQCNIEDLEEPIGK